MNPIGDFLEEGPLDPRDNWIEEDEDNELSDEAVDDEDDSEE
jgi:hypothetical protein